MLRVVKLLLKGEAGVCALNSHGNYIVDHGKSWNCVFEFLCEPCNTIVVFSFSFRKLFYMPSRSCVLPAGKLMFTFRQAYGMCFPASPLV